MDDRVREIAARINALAGSNRRDVSFGALMDEETFSRVRAQLDNPPVKSTLYSHDREVIESISVEVDGVTFRAQRARAATPQEIARITTDEKAVDHSIAYRWVTL